jgi:hypothetical protein
MNLDEKFDASFQKEIDRWKGVMGNIITVGAAHLATSSCFCSYMLKDKILEFKIGTTKDVIFVDNMLTIKFKNRG